MIFTSLFFLIDSKSVRFDVYTKGDNKIFDIEIQTTNKKNLPKRSRYYQSIIDMSNLNAGTDYDELKDTYIIFICMNDIFNKGLPVYSFENICNEDKATKLNDRALKVFFNASSYDKLSSDEEKSFFKFLQGKEAESDLTKKLENKIAIAKKNAEWRVQYMTWEQTLKEEHKIAYNDGFEDGEHETKIANAKRLLADCRYTAEEISQLLDIPIESFTEPVSTK